MLMLAHSDSHCSEVKAVHGDVFTFADVLALF